MSVNTEAAFLIRGLHSTLGSAGQYVKCPIEHSGCGASLHCMGSDKQCCRKCQVTSEIKRGHSEVTATSTTKITLKRELNEFVDGVYLD
ncbi:hypothetical protein CDAR_34091 [Caerostris darwini]|uniref:Uncharacterized protein n=1 Tax=Caerostris darwini TaxID=1538125 RepID=A0AAV4RFG0_9ARAC|nr:hypothetical protein CDAR_34091 [Caerostris darwini]